MRKQFLVCMISLCYSTVVYGATKPPIITREQWGADESLRLGFPPPALSLDNVKGPEETNLTPAQKQAVINSYLVNNFPKEFHTDEIIRTRNGKTVLWPIQINHNKTRIVIHHTAAATPSTASYDEIVDELRRIYVFHTMSRRWGDIGYNYIIGPDGSIFEGRSGGPSAVGAHAVNNNASSIGISLMGNFDQTQPTAAQLDASIKLVAWLADRYKINLSRKVTYHVASKEYPYITDITDISLIGHGDVGDTSCPGHHLEDKLSTIRQEATALMDGVATDDSTPVVSDPVRYYIPSTSYQLSIPWSATDQVTSCTSDSTVRSVKKCDIADGYLTLNLNKNTNEYHVGYHKITLQTPRGQYYLNLSLEYQTPKEIPYKQVVSIPSIAQSFTGSRVNVLLYELTHHYNQWIVQCTGSCSLSFGVGPTISLPSNFRFQLTKQGEKLIFWLNNNQYIIPQLTLNAVGTGFLEIANYDREIQAQKLNKRRGSLQWKLGSYKPIGQDTQTGITITNTIRVDDYMRGLAITQPDTPQSYHDALYVVAHTNTRYWGDTLTDNSQIHQYYGGAGAELLDYKRQLSNDTQRNQVLYNESNLTYAPVFECSDGRTRNGVADIGVCTDSNSMQGSIIGLSRLGARMLSQRGYTTRQIIEYYYPGTAIKTIH